MYISPVTCSDIYSRNRYKQSKPNFMAHPDFYKYNSTVSCYFRRGSVLLSGGGYKDIENLYAGIFEKPDKQKQILIAGIGSSQEPFSHLASIKGIIKDRTLKDNVDLYTVDLQSKPSEYELKKQAFPHMFEYEKFPKYAQKSFVKDSYDRWFVNPDRESEMNPVDKYLYSLMFPELLQKILHYRVNDEIFDFLKGTYDNSAKSKWDSRIQEAILDYPDNKFDVISANNILPYIQPEADEIETIKHIGRVLKPKGYFITDPYEFRTESLKTAGWKNFKEIAPGIYQKG